MIIRGKFSEFCFLEKFLGWNLGDNFVTSDRIEILPVKSRRTY